MHRRLATTTTIVAPGLLGCHRGFRLLLSRPLAIKEMKMCTLLKQLATYLVGFSLAALAAI